MSIKLFLILFEIACMKAFTLIAALIAFEFMLLLLTLLVWVWRPTR